MTVVIPTRNRWSLLSRTALRAALGQVDVDHEIVVVDDGSTDQTSERLARSSDPRLHVIRLTERRGVAAARNAGVAAARGSWLAFLDDDDIWSPRKLREQLDAARDARADYAYGGVVAVDEDLVPHYVFPLPTPVELPVRLLSSSVLPAGCSNVLARTELVRDLGGFDEQLFQLADWDLWIRLAHAGRGGACAEILVAYLEHRDNMLLSDDRDVTVELTYLDRKHQALRQLHHVSIDRRVFYHWVAWGHLRRRQRLRAAQVFLRSGIETRSFGDARLALAFALRAAGPASSLRMKERLPTRGGSRPAVVDPDWLQPYRVGAELEGRSSVVVQEGSL